MLQASIFHPSISCLELQNVIGVFTLADAILDRVVHSADRIEVAGERLAQPPAAALMIVTISAPEDAEIGLARPAARQGRG